jgi:putative Mg2+ transporter-C (MgtC) family protein
MSRVLQGLITGIGFLGGGAILKLTSEKEVLGLTTAAGIWLAAAIGIATGLGRVGTALMGTMLAYGILSVVYHWEQRMTHKP